MVQIHWDNVKEKAKIVAFGFVPPILRFLATVAIGALVAVCSVLVYNSPPREYTYASPSFNWTFDPRTLRTLDPNFTYNVFMDTHSHSTYSDGSLPPDELIQWHIANGYNALVVTDHNTVEGSIVAQQIAREKYNNSIKVITGMEWTNCRCHLNLIGINQTLTPIKWPTDEQIQQVIQQTHALGGVVVYNHRPWSTWASLDQPTIQQFADWGVDFFDIVNQLYFDMQTYLWAKANGYAIVAANDFHGSQTALGWTVFNIDGVVYNQSAPVNAEYFTEEQLFAAFIKKNTSIIFDITGSGYDTDYALKTNPKYEQMLPWIMIGQYFHSFYTLERGTYSFVDGNCGTNHVVVYTDYIKTTIAWFISLFILGEVVRAIAVFIFKLIKRYRQHRASKRDPVDRFSSLAFDRDFGVIGTPLLNSSL